MLTTIRSLSRQASKFNPSIPVIGPKLAAARAPVAPSKPATEIPAWSTAQYGFISNAGEGVVSSGRRDIVPKARKPPPPPPKIMIKSKTTSAAARPPPVPKKPSIFNDDSDDQKSESKTNQPSEKKNISLMAPYQVPPKSVISKPQDELDPSIYAYDEFYDEMKQTEKIKKGLNVDKDRKACEIFFFMICFTGYLLTRNIQPKYMNQLLESKKIRERDRLRAQDVKIRREREKEGDEFDDKEVFITPAYKALQEEMIKASEVEEKERESNSSSNFNRILLEKTLQSRGACFQSEPVQSAGVSNVEKPTPDVVSTTVEPETLKSGLNVSLKRARPSSPPSTGSSFSKSTGSNYSSNKRSGRRSDETSRIVRQYEEQQRQKEAEAMESRERMLAQVLSKSGSKQDSVKSARERYLERKKKAAAGK